MRMASRARIMLSAVAAMALNGLGVAHSQAAGTNDPGAETPSLSQPGAPFGVMPERFREYEQDFDRAHEKLSDNIVHIAERIDRYLGRKICDPSQLTAMLDVELGWEYRQVDGFAALVGVGGQIELPALHERLSLFLDRFDPDADATRDLELKPEEEEFEAGFRHELIEWGDRLSARVDVSARLAMPIVVLTKLRIDQKIRIEPWLLKFDEYVFWYSDEGFGLTTRATALRRLPQAAFFRSSTKATLSEATDGVEIGQSLLVVRTLREKHTIGSHLFVIGHTAPEPEADIYAFQVKYQRCCWRKWFGYEITPEIAWELDNEYRPNPGVKFEVVITLGR
ncbi:MAG: hypothetical protein JXR37_16860 [Kiritimatiellae bacterium]|nr:hypothetical protein [Kiritimatiellia bacterium]